MNPKIDITDVILRTERMTLRFWKEDDLDDLFEYASIPGVGEMAGWKHHENKDVSQTVLSMFISEKNCFCLEMNGKVVGSLGIEKYSESLFPEFENKKGRELGFVLSKGYWGRGLMKEAVDAVLRYLFDVVGLDFVTCIHSLGNAQSARVQEKCGFVPVKEIDYVTRMNTVERAVATIITRDDFEKRENL